MMFAGRRFSVSSTPMPISWNTSTVWCPCSGRGTGGAEDFSPSSQRTPAVAMMLATPGRRRQLLWLPIVFGESPWLPGFCSDHFLISLFIS